MTARKKTTKIVIHCSATRPSANVNAEVIRNWHKTQGWSDIGYAAVIKRDGQIEFGRHFDDIGAHVAGWNSISVGICMAGGLREDGSNPDEDYDLYTQQQWISLYRLVGVLKLAYPNAEVCGHRDLSPDQNHDGIIQRREWLKTCPGFDVKKWAEEMDL